MFRWLLQNKTFTALSAFAALVTGVFYYFELRRTAEQDARERYFKFHEITNEAEQRYCRTRDTGVPGNLKVLIDQAILLEPGISDRLSSLNYLTMASVGSLFLSYDEVTRFGHRSLDLAKNPFDKYAANLILGHIDFQEYQDHRRKSNLEAGRRYFDTARKLVDGNNSQRDLYFLGQLYLIWGTNELARGEVPVGDDLIIKARTSWTRLPQNDDWLKQIENDVAQARKKIPPQLPCLSTIAVSPHYFASTSNSGKSGPAPDVASDKSPQRSGSGDVSFQLGVGEKFDALTLDLATVKNDITTFKNDIASQITDVRKRLPPENSSPPATNPNGPPKNGENSQPKLGPDEPRMPRPSPPSSSPQQLPPRSRFDPRINPDGCAFRLVNTSNHAIRPVVNGHSPPDYSIPAGERAIFYFLCAPLTIERRDNGETRSWDSSIFWHAGQKITPTIEMSNCCMERVN